jgi:hypothetical protein
MEMLALIGVSGLLVLQTWWLCFEDLSVFTTVWQPGGGFQC